MTEIAKPFPISLNSVSKHIRMLERADMVRRRRAGREHVLTLNPHALDETAAWIDQQRAMWTRTLDRLDLVLKEQAHDWTYD